MLACVSEIDIAVISSCVVRIWVSVRFIVKREEVFTVILRFLGWDRLASVLTSVFGVMKQWCAKLAG